MTDTFQHSLITSYKYKIYHPFIKAISDYSLINPDDKIAVCISGGKDSFLMAECFKELVKYSKVPFDCVYLLMDPGYKAIDIEKIMNNAKLLKINLVVFKTDIFSISSLQGKKQCYICAKMRRGALYSKAKELGCNKIALAHHFNDVIETTLLSIFYSGEIETMLPKVDSDNYEGMSLIRPMYYVKENDICSYEKDNGLSFLKCACPSEEASCDDDSSKRKMIKKIIKELENNNNAVEQNIFKCVDNVNLNKILGYRKDNQYFSLFKVKKSDGN